MKRWIAALLTAVGVIGTSQAYAQDSVPGPGAVVVRSKDDTPAFFGQETRYGHRVYGGILISAR